MKYLDLWSPGLRIFFEKFVKPSAPPPPLPPPTHSYILNVRSLRKKYTRRCVISLFYKENQQIPTDGMLIILAESLKFPNFKASDG